MTEPSAEAFSHAALAMISDLLENHTPIAARWLPEDPAEAEMVLQQLLQAGQRIAALAQAALMARDGESV